MRVSRGCGDLKSGARAVSAHVSPTQILPLLSPRPGDVPRACGIGEPQSLPASITSDHE